MPTPFCLFVCSFVCFCFSKKIFLAKSHRNCPKIISRHEIFFLKMTKKLRKIFFCNGQKKMCEIFLSVFQKKNFFSEKFFLAKNPFWTFPMLFSQKKFFEKNFVFWKKYAKWRGHLDFWGIFLASECPELYKNAYMSPGRIKSVYSFNFRTLWNCNYILLDHV